MTKPKKTRSVKPLKPVQEMLSPVECADKLVKILSTQADYTLEFLGQILSKKNNYQPLKNGKGFFKPTKVKNYEQMMYLQMDEELKDLKLRNPHIMIQRQVPKISWRSDRDNAVTAILDCLKNYGVLQDDCISHCNGFFMEAPVIEGPEHKTIVRLWKNEN